MPVSKIRTRQKQRSEQAAVDIVTLFVECSDYEMSLLQDSGVGVGESQSEVLFGSVSDCLWPGDEEGGGRGCA